MTDIKIYVEAKIKHLEDQKSQMEAGIKARTELKSKYEEKKATLEDSAKILNKQNLDTTFIKEVEESLKEDIEQNNNILSNLENYLEENNLELEVYKKSLEVLI